MRYCLPATMYQRDTDGIGSIPSTRSPAAERGNMYNNKESGRATRKVDTCHHTIHHSHSMETPSKEHERGDEAIHPFRASAAT
nr:hypothetical protein Iba_scaffold5767CG0480 [Ipomoea batatas]GME12318.1 hypothetical protein Iba_scaffold13560CG0050 [Ipomoea batatas]